MLTAPRAAGGVLVLAGALALWEARRFPLGSLARPGPGYVPIVLALVLIGFGLLILARGGAGARLATLDWGEARHALAILGACAFVALGLERLGWRLTVALALFFLFRVLERRSTPFALVLTLAIALGSFWIFNTLLRVPLPRGPFGL